VSELEKLVAALKEEITALKVNAGKLEVHDKWQKAALAVMTLLVFGVKSDQIKEFILKVLP
jgi:hypothetical protein